MRPFQVIRYLKSLSALYSRSHSGLNLGCNTFVNMSSAAKPKVFVTRCASSIPEDGMKLLKQYCEVSEWTDEEAIPRKELLQHVKGIDGLFCLLTDKIDAEMLDAAGESLKVISTMSVGYDHVDVAECAKRGIPVGYTPDVLTNATAELTVSLLLNTSRRLNEVILQQPVHLSVISWSSLNQYWLLSHINIIETMDIGIAAVKNGRWGAWKPLWMCGQGLDRSTVGIIGFGRIGFAVAQRLRPFGVAKVLYADRREKAYANDVSAEFVSLDKLLAESDFVVCCCTLTMENAGMMNSVAFSKMKPNSILINTSRGGLVNQDDLYEALKTGKIGAAGLDVTTPEPLPTDHPLLSLNNCVILPHIGSATLQSRGAMAELCAMNILNVLNGKPMEAQVNPSLKTPIS